MGERENTYVLADRLLDVPNADPDDDIRTLARQLLRHRGREERIVRWLAERAAWLKYEREHGGSSELKAQEDECRYLAKTILGYGYWQDARPSWLVKAIEVPEIKAGVA